MPNWCAAWCRNLLQEFTPRNEKFNPGGENVKAFRQMLRNRTRSEPIVALVGFREWIFSGKVLPRPLPAAACDYGRPCLNRTPLPSFAYPGSCT